MRTKKIVVAIAALVLVAAVVCVGLFWRDAQLKQRQEAALQELERNVGQYDEQSIVLYGTSKVEAQKLAQLYDAQLRITADGRFATLTLPEGTTIRDVYAMEESREYIDRMAADYHVQTSDLEEETEDGERLPARPQYSVADTDYELQTYLDYLNMGAVWNNYTGSGVTVAVIDTGIDTDHPEFAGRISEYSYNASEDKVVKDHNDWSVIEDEYGHGTAVTGVIAASMNSGNVVGIAPNVEIIVIKAECDGKGRFERTSDLVFGIYYAIERDVDVINMSFGGSSKENPYEEALQLAYDSDIICVAAAGNESTSTITWPAADEHVIGVGALDGWELAFYSNYGENTNLVAPGTTYTTIMGGRYGNMTGTSLASPVVAGAMALLLQNDPYMTFDEVTQILYASCYDLGALGRDWYYGFGALDISALVLEERGTIIYDMMTDELTNQEGIFIQGHTLQELPEPERLYAVFDGWYYDDTFTQEYNYYEDAFYGEVTLYAKWANEEDGIPYTYVVLDDGTVEILSYTGHRKYITIPEVIEGKVVSSIGDFAFADQTRLREVVLPSGLTHIGKYAFQNCANLTSVRIPENVTAIDDYAFAGNVRLSTVAFSGSKLLSIGDYAFMDCGRLERLELPASVYSVNGSAFMGASSLYEIRVQQGSGSFQSREGVLLNLSGSRLVAFPAAWGTSYTLPASVTHIGPYAFAGANLREIGLANVSGIGDFAFNGAQLETVTIPDGVTTLGTGAFNSCEQLSQVTFGTGLTRIPEKAFQETTSLQSVQIPANILSIEVQAFKESGLSSIAFVANSSLLHIGDEAFISSGLSQIQIPETVLEIGDSAFSKAPLTQVGFGENSQLHTIGDAAFKECMLLQQIALPSNLRTIGDAAFQSTGLTDVTVPASVTKLGDGAFANCSDLAAVTVESGNTVYHAADGVVYNLDNTVIHTYPAGKAGDNYSLQTTTMIVNPWAFAGAENLTYIHLPESLTEIGIYGFADCVNLNSVQIPDNVVQIGRFAFSGNSRMYTVTFGEDSKLPRLGYAAFAYSAISTIRIPASVSAFGQNVFEGCSNLSNVSFAAGSKLESISAYMFAGCDNLRSITFEPSSALTSIQAHGLEGMKKLISIDFGDAKLTNIDNFAFRFCERLSELNLPETVTNIGRYAFYECSNLSRLTIPVGVEHIGSYAFLGTKDLEVYFVGEMLPRQLDENWDYGIRGYYTGVSAVSEGAGYRYAVLPSGNVAILEYLGHETHLDLSQVRLGGPVTIIGGSAFKGSPVTSVVLPETLTAIQAEAFADSALEEVHIPANVTFIGREAFANTNIASLTFASGSKLTVVEQYAFTNTKNLTAVTLPASLSTMGIGAFQTSGLQSLAFEPGIALTEIPQRAFAQTKLTSAVLPDSVTLVNHDAFNNVQTLQSITFGNNDGIRLMSNAFYQTGLTSLHIPANVTYIGEYCFVSLSSLTEFSVDANNPNYKAEDGLLLNKSGRKLIAVPTGRTGSLTVPKGVEEIGFGAFENSKLSEILFHPDANILSFGYRAFFGAENITSITIPKSVVTIDYYAFAYCESLKEVIFADGIQLTGIYEGAFCGDVNLETITIPDSIVEISDFAFYGCSKITELPVSEHNQLLSIGDYAFAHTNIGGEFTVPETVSSIGNYAFMGTKLTKLTVPDANQKQLIIGLGAFQDCNQLTEVTLPFIGASFEDAEISWFGYIFGAGSYSANETYVPESLKTVTITEGISNIYTGGFAYCTGLETIHVPHSVSVLWTDAFVNTTAKYTLTNIITGYVHRDWQAMQVLESNHFGSGLYGSLTISGDTKEVAVSEYTLFGGPEGLTSVTLLEGVEAIGHGAFRYCTNLTSITLPDSLTSIGSGAFGVCEKLTSITIPNGVTSLGGEAFELCSNLTDITLPSGITVIPDRLFSGCSSLCAITIPDGVTSIGEWAFSGCNNLTSVTLGQSVATIGGSAFEGCYNLMQVTNRSTLPLTLGSMDYGWVAFSARSLVDAAGNQYFTDNTMITADGFLFDTAGGSYVLRAYVGEESTVTLPQSINGNEYTINGFTGAAHVVIPDSFTSIPDGAFYGCAGMTEITIPNTVTSIGNSAFSACWGLTSILIPDSVTSIGNSAFEMCHNLTEITLGAGVSSIGDNVFTLCNLQKIHLSESNAHFRLVDGILYDNPATKIVCVAKQLPDTVVIPEGVTAIADTVFQGCNGMTNLVIPGSVTHIGDWAFADCPDLVNVTLSHGVDSLGSGAFSGSYNLTTIHLPDSITSMGGQLFRGCESLSSITIPAGITEIESAVFSGCYSLTEVTIPAGVTRIADYAFRACVGLTSITVPSAVTSIGEAAFCDCSNLTDVKIQGTVTDLEARVFENCTSLASFAVPNGVTCIGSNAFSNCTSLTEVTIPASVSEIGDGAFGGCTALGKLAIAEENPFFCFLDGILYDKEVTRIIYVSNRIPAVVTIPDTVTSLGSAFHDCTALTGVIIPGTMTYIEDSAFYNCKNLRNVSIPEGVTEIGFYAFYGCRSLTSITIPGSVTTIKECAFLDCGSLFHVINHSDLALTFDSREHGDIAMAARVLTNKDGSRQYYKDTYFETEDHFLWDYAWDTYQLVGYLGEEDTVILPLQINGCNYEINQLRGVCNVIIPDGMTQISGYAFTGCGNLASITIPNSVTYIGDGAFSYCTGLTSIHIPESVTSIGMSAFYGCTGLLNNPEYQHGGLTIIDGWLVRVDTDVEYIDGIENLRGAVGGAYDDCNLLKNAIWCGVTLPSNVETLYITGINSNTWPIPNSLTLKNVVICDSVDASAMQYCPTLIYNLNGVTIYVEALESDLRWDANFPGWSNDNEVIYQDQWHWVEFYDEQDNLIFSEPCKNSQIIRIPAHEIQADAQYTYQIIGWDLDGDGQPDSIPATSVTDLRAQPVVQKTLRSYSVVFMDAATGIIYQQQQLPYGTAITMPSNPEKMGYDFVGWTGFSGEETVTGDVVIYASWRHHGSGHEYAAPVWVDATCTEPGFNKHSCTICGEYYGTDYTKPLGHNYADAVVAPTCTEQGYVLHSCSTCGHSYSDTFQPAISHSYGDWITDVAAKCETEGTKHRDCANCGHSESGTIPAKGHAFAQAEHTASTCTKEGVQTLRCNDCGLTIQETLPLGAHHFEKQLSDQRFIDQLLALLPDILWGYEGEQVYYYTCSECGHIMNMDEWNAGGVGVASTVCRHPSAAWKTLQAPSCIGLGLEGYVCDSCGEVMELRTFGNMSHAYEPVVTAPTCTEAGYTTYTCICGDSYVADHVDALGHEFADGVCTRCGQEEAILGDVNGDGRINARDARALLRYIAGLAEESEIKLAAADFNGDGRVNARDARALLRFIAGLD